MSSFASLAQRLILAKRKTKAQNQSFKIPQPYRVLDSLAPALSDRIPQEVFERFIYYLSNDLVSLSRCSLVCRAWLPASRYHLFRSLIVRPLQSNWISPFQFNCSTALSRLQTTLYGTADGIYMAGIIPDLRPIRVLLVPDVTNIGVMEEHDLVIFISAHQLMTIPLGSLNLEHVQDINSCSRVSSHVSFFKIGVQMGRPFVCIVKSGLSSVLKIMKAASNSGHCCLETHTEFYIPTKVVSVHFLKTKIVAGTNSRGFEVIDIETLETQSLLNPANPLPDMKSAKCVAVYRVDGEFLVCYNSFAIYVNSHGQLSRDKPIRWRLKSIQAAALREPYMLAFSPTHIEVRYIKTGALLQTIWIEHTLLSTLPGLFMIQSHDGRVIGLEFID